VRGATRGVADRNESSKARSVGSVADETDGLDGGGKEECMALVVRPGMRSMRRLGKGCSRLSRALCSAFRRPVACVTKIDRQS